ncbi:MAG: tyrosine-type recombinase/integrase [Pseudomonadota bacterium]
MRLLVGFTHALTELAYDHNILDENGNVWQFHSHQFRHTVGTRMINAGVPQTIVQKYLGHESPEMTARYAHIHDETLKTAFNDYQGKLIDIHGELRYRNNKDEYAEAKWLQYNTMSQALPNGICGLPSPQQRCPHANACLTCVHFRTHQQFLPQHQNQLEMTNKIIETAKANSWQRQVEMNIAVKNNLEKIISRLQEDK